MAEANELLRAARKRTASLTCPGVCLSRQELAELVNTWVWEHHDKKVVVATANYLGKLERGLIRWPGALFREALRAILGAPTDAALGFVNARARRWVVKLEDVDQQRLLRRRTALGAGALGSGALVLGPVAALLGGTEPTLTPRGVGVTEIEQTRDAKLVFQSWSWRYGGGMARDAVRGQLHWSAGLLDALCPARLRPALFSAVIDLANTAGYMAMDAGDHEEARRIYRFALACAEDEENGDWHLRAEVLGHLGVLAIRTGQPDEALTLAEQALVRADRLTATQRSTLHTDRASALARMRRVQEALTAIGTADDHFAQSTPANDPPFLAVFHNPAVHALRTGGSLFTLGILGHDPGAAADRLTTAVTGLTDYTHPRAIGLIELASLTMATGDPLQAAAIGVEALDAAGALRSRRVADDLRELSRYADTHQNLEEVAHLRHRINTLLVRTDSSP